MADQNNVFYNLSYTHQEIEELLRRMASGNVLSVEDYEKLINIIGLDNISTFSGNFEDLNNIPLIAQRVSDLENDVGYTTAENVNQKMDALRENLVSLINEYENENESIFANQEEMDRMLNNLDYSLRIFVENQIAQLPLNSFATKTALSFKADTEHLHEMADITGLNRELNLKSDVGHNHDLLYADKYTEHVHDNEEVLDALTQSQVDYWNDSIDENNLQIGIINDKLDDLDRDDLIETWKVLHSGYDRDTNGNLIETGMGHTNLEVLNKITDAQLSLWSNSTQMVTDKAATVSVGGIDAGLSLNGYTVQQLLIRMLCPDKKPTLSVSMNCSPSGTSFEIGQTVTINTIVANITQGSNTIKTVELLVGGTVRQTKSDATAGGSVSFSIGDKVTSAVSAGYYAVRVTDSADNIISANCPGISFNYPCYYGSVAESITAASITAAQITALTKNVGAKGNKTFTYNTNNQRMVFAYPKSFGALKSITDPNGFEQLRAFESSTKSITVNGQAIDYYVYINNANTNTNFSMTYKF